jgi:hypothetical protein
MTRPRFHLAGYPPMEPKDSDRAVAWVLSNDSGGMAPLGNGVAYSTLLSKFHDHVRAPSNYREGDAQASLRRMEREGWIEKVRRDGYPRRVAYRLTDAGLEEFFCRECGEPKHGGCARKS